MQPGRSRTPAILTTPERAQSKHSPSTPDSSLTNIENDLRAREYQGAIPKGTGISPHTALLRMMLGRIVSQI